MKKLKILCLLATLWLMVGGCKNRNRDGCDEGPAITYGRMRMTIVDDLGRSYQAAKQLPIGSIVVYDANLNYATAFDGTVSWEQEKNRYFGDFSQMTVDFAGRSKAIGVMHSQIFYIKLDKDMDTLKVDYKIEDKCMSISNFKAFYNDNLIHTESKIKASATYDFDIIKK